MLISDLISHHHGRSSCDAYLVFLFKPHVIASDNVNQSLRKLRVPVARQICHSHAYRTVGDYDLVPDGDSAAAVLTRLLAGCWPRSLSQKRSNRLSLISATAGSPAEPLDPPETPQKVFTLNGLQGEHPKSSPGRSWEAPWAQDAAASCLWVPQGTPQAPPRNLPGTPGLPQGPPGSPQGRPRDPQGLPMDPPEGVHLERPPR